MYKFPYRAQQKRHPESTPVKKMRAGFSAIEVMVGAVLMMGLIAGVLHLIRQGNYMIELARDHTRTTQILQSKIEDMRTYRWIDIGPEGNVETFTPEGQFASSFGTDYVCYIWNWDLIPGEKKQVYVYAFWKDSKSRSHFTIFTTRFTKDGLNDYYYRAI